MTFIPAAQEDLAGLLNREVWERVRLLAPTPARPVLSASLILIDGSGAQPRVLMGKRHPGDRFMPDKFVFPGGCVAPDDKRMNVAGMLPELVEMRLAKVGPAYSLPRALAGYGGPVVLPTVTVRAVDGAGAEGGGAIPVEKRTLLAVVGAAVAHPGAGV